MVSIVVLHDDCITQIEAELDDFHRQHPNADICLSLAGVADSTSLASRRSVPYVPTSRLSDSPRARASPVKCGPPEPTVTERHLGLAAGDELAPYAGIRRVAARPEDGTAPHGGTIEG